MSVVRGSSASSLICFHRFFGSNIPQGENSVGYYADLKCRGIHSSQRCGPIILLNGKHAEFQRPLSPFGFDRKCYLFHGLRIHVVLKWHSTCPRVKVIRLWCFKFLVYFTENVAKRRTHNSFKWQTYWVSEASVTIRLRQKWEISLTLIDNF